MSSGTVHIHCEVLMKSFRDAYISGDKKWRDLEYVVYIAYLHKVNVNEANISNNSCLVSISFDSLRLQRDIVPALFPVILSWWTSWLLSDTNLNGFLPLALTFFIYESLLLLLQRFSSAECLGLRKKRRRLVHWCRPSLFKRSYAEILITFIRVLLFVIHLFGVHPTPWF